MTQTVLYIACSLDGKIARLDDSLDWLFAFEGDGDNGYATFIQDVGAVIMGRKTFDEVLILSDDYPYSAIDNYVLTRQTGKQSEYAMFTNEPLDVLLDRIGPTIDGKIWLVGGGELIQEALRLKRVDQMELAIAPVVRSPSRTGTAVNTAQPSSPSGRRTPIVTGSWARPVIRARVTGYSCTLQGEPSSKMVSGSQSAV